VVAGALLGIGVSHLLRKLYDHPKNNWKVLVDGQGIKLARSFGGSDGKDSR
jgi:hypothetical protein